MASKPMQVRIANQSLNSMPGSMKTVNMATIQPPPRKSKRTNEVTILRNKSSLETLMQMGFPKARAEKSLAATGDKGVQLASDWLLSHVNDPTLDVKIPREYVLYLCPVGTLQQQLLEFWHKSYIECGWNRAHNYFPHITLCSFFKADDCAATPLAHALKNVGERISNPPKYIGLEYFSSTNFIGLFVSENEAPFLKQVTADFAEEAKKLGVTVEPHKKQLHVSLAYQFPTEMKEKLESLAKVIQVNSLVRWDIRLYSRDAKKPNTQLWKVLYTYTPRAPDEIELIDGDFVYLDEQELEGSPDGWFKGTSWLTGCTGMLPGSYAERTSESETWTLHRSIPITGAECAVPKFDGGSTESSPSHSRLQNGSAGSRVIANARNNQTCATAILRGTETLPARLPELTTIRNSEASGPITANNILYATVGDAVSGFLEFVMSRHPEISKWIV